MHPLARQLAAVVASTDAVPRLVTQFPDVFLVTPQGDVWRIFDADDPAGETRHPPASDPRMRTRIFIGSGMSPEVRFYEFADGEPRSIGAERLYWQLLASRPRG